VIRLTGANAEKLVSASLYSPLLDTGNATGARTEAALQSNISTLVSMTEFGIYPAATLLSIVSPCTHEVFVNEGFC